MKTRAELLAERKAKASAAERTKPMFEKDDEKKSEEKPATPASGQVKCTACEAVVDLAKLEKRDDGSFECSECAAPIKLGDDKPKTKKVDDEDDKPKTKKVDEDEEKPKPPNNSARSGSFCGECGAEWPILDGKLMINCSHAKALRVDDPRKARNMAGVTASGVPNPPPGPPSMHVPPPYTNQTPTISMLGNRLSIGWPKTSYPVGEAMGMKYSNMEIPATIVSVDLPEGADRIEAARAILADLQKIADLTFDTTFAWYKKKLGLLDK